VEGKLDEAPSSMSTRNMSLRIPISPFNGWSLTLGGNQLKLKDTYMQGLRDALQYW
jgi:hypothetical protein